FAPRFARSSIPKTSGSDFISQYCMRDSPSSIESARHGIGDDRVQRDVPGCKRQRGYTLELVCDADQPRALPAGPLPQKLEAAIVEAATGAEAPAVLVEGKQRRENDIEESRIDA